MLQQLARLTLTCSLLALPLTLIACESGGAMDRDSDPMRGAQAQSADGSKSEAQMGWTGVLGEDEFAALHEMREGKAPKLHGELITLPGGSRAYLSLPKSGTATAAITVIHEWWGLNEHIQHWADRLAALGYAALAVDLYGGQTASQPKDAMELMKAVDGDKAAAVLADAHRFLAEDSRVRAKKRGVIGWCFGGAWSLHTAMAHADLDAAVLYYGRLVTDPAQLAAIEAPILGVFGNQDTGIPPAKVDEFEAALKEAGEDYRILRYDAPHAFANPSSARYRQEPAAAAWKEVQAFLAKHLR
jgi:carboxymethylenebutenolidase